MPSFKYLSLILHLSLVLNRLGSHPKSQLKDEGTQAYLYTQQPGNQGNVGQITNYKQLQNQLQQ